MENKENDSFIWFPKLLNEIAETIQLTRGQLDIEVEISRIDAATKQQITYGIEEPPLDFKALIDNLFDNPRAQTQLFYVASEMSDHR